MSPRFPETILQFGTGKFLRAFADLMVHEQNASGQPVGYVAMVQSTGAERAAMLNRQQGCYHVAIRGLERGQTIDRLIEVRSVRRGLVAATQWEEVLALARSPDLRLIVSNTTEAGYRLEDEMPGPQPPRSFPAKLLRVLEARFGAGLGGVTILPCELLDNNGLRLRELVIEQARRWDLPGPLVAWLRSACAWPNTLVDRIVSAPAPDDPWAQADPLFAVAEPFVQWLVEGSATAAGLLAHPAVQRVEELQPYTLRKVRILNGAHTALVAKAMAQGFATVRAAVEDPSIRSWLESLLFEEIVPTLAGRTDQPELFARQTLERFANPFLEHRLADIALHHAVKVQTRLVPTYHEFRERFGRVPRLLGEIVADSARAEIR